MDENLQLASENKSSQSKIFIDESDAETGHARAELESNDHNSRIETDSINAPSSRKCVEKKDALRRSKSASQKNHILCLVCGETLTRADTSGRNPKFCMSCVELVNAARNKRNQIARNKGTSNSGKGVATSLYRLLESQNFLCALTGEVLTPENAALDHKTPLSRGGTNDIENLQWLTKEANTAKASMTNDEFIAVCALVARKAAK